MYSLVLGLSSAGNFFLLAVEFSVILKAKTFGNFSVKYPTKMDLLELAKRALNDDEYEELKESKLGIFIKFKEMNFDWALMLAYYMLGFQLDIKKKYELWCLVGPEPVRFSLIEFEHLTGLNCNYFEDTENLRCVIIASCERCGDWSRDDRMWLGYLAIFTGFIEGRKYSTATRACLARVLMDLEVFENYPWGRVAFKVWVYFAMPELGVNSGRPLPNRPSPPLLAFSGISLLSSLLKYLKLRLLRSLPSHVVHYIEKDFDEMFTKCDDEAEDTAADNIIKIMFNAPKYWKPQKKGSKEPPADDRKEALTDERKEAPAEDRSKSSIGVDGMSKAQIEQGFKDLVDSMRDGFQMCLQEIKLIGDRLEAVEKKVGISKKRLHLMIFNSLLQLSINVGTKSGVKVLMGRNQGRKTVKNKVGLQSSKELSLVIANVNDPKMTEAKVTEPTVDPSVVLLDKGIPTKSNIQQQEDRRHTKKDIALGSSIAKVIIPNTKIVHGYDPFAPVDKKRTNVLIDWLKLDICYKTTVAKKTSGLSKFVVLHPPKPPSMAHRLGKSSENPIYNGRLPETTGSLLEWYDKKPQLFSSERMCFLDHVFSRVWRAKYMEFKSSEPDRNMLGRRLSGGSWDLYAVNYNNDHWIAIWISIPNKHIVVWDSILKHIKPAVLDEPFQIRTGRLLGRSWG
ncbi:hypothetical protein F2Q70_00009355 [Brassica cretica]|uniref:DUF1985 domain-containing protein n=1 Tax=Brassica cretica TaxID=69181 RepID=A0A8S9M8X6_BRACR|nr:hypothetical protein F2Q70_00009355 [Brassica cretica]